RVVGKAPRLRGVRGLTTSGCVPRHDRELIGEVIQLPAPHATVAHTPCTNTSAGPAPDRRNAIRSPATSTWFVRAGFPHLSGPGRQRLLRNAPTAGAASRRPSRRGGGRCRPSRVHPDSRRAG